MSRVNFHLHEKSDVPSDLKIIIGCYGPYLTVKEAAQCLHKSTDFIYELLRARGLRFSRTGKNGGYIIPAASIAAYARKFEEVAQI